VRVFVFVCVCVCVLLIAPFNLRAVSKFLKFAAAASGDASELRWFESLTDSAHITGYVRALQRRGFQPSAVRNVLADVLDAIEWALSTCTGGPSQTSRVRAYERARAFVQKLRARGTKSKRSAERGTSHV
jgi:hypothetical protein